MKRSLVDLVLAALIALVILLGLVLAGTISRGRWFQVDEIEHLHAAYNMRDGRVIYRDFWEGHNPLLYVLLQPIVDVDDPVATYGRSRIMMAAFFLAVLGLTAFVAHRLAGGLAAATAVGLLVWQSTFVERGIEVRPDLLYALAVAAALALELSRLSSRTRVLLQALVLALGFLATQKIAVVTCVFGLRWIELAWKERRPSLVLAPCLVWGATVGVAALAVWWAGALSRYIEYNVTEYARHASRTLTVLHFGPERYLGREVERNPLFTAIAIAGLAYGAASVTRRASSFGSLRVPLGAAVVLLATLWINPFPFPYILVSVVPTLAVLAAAALAEAATRLGRSAPWRGYLLVLACLSATAVTSLPHLVAVTGQSSRPQFDALRQVHAITSQDDTVFDLSGLYFRPDAYPMFVMTLQKLARYRLGSFPPLIPALRGAAPACVVTNFRLVELPRAERRFIAERFVRYTGPLFVPGRVVLGLEPGEQEEFEVLSDLAFRYSGDGVLVVDGAPFSRGVLRRGYHKLGAAEQIRGGLLVRELPPPIADLPMHGLYPKFE